MKVKSSLNRTAARIYLVCVRGKRKGGGVGDLFCLVEAAARMSPTLKNTSSV